MGAVRKNLARASGKTTVPMSLPSATTRPLAPMRRCKASSPARTSAKADTCEAPSEISGRRISSLTSSPSTAMWLTPPRSSNRMSRLRMSWPSARPSDQAMSRRRAAHAPARYRAPESRNVYPRRRARPLATVDLPAPAGPSMATTNESVGPDIKRAKLAALPDKGHRRRRQQSDNMML